MKLATIVEGDPEAPFLIATTSRCRGGHYTFPWIAPFYPWSLQCWVLNKEESSTIFWVFGMTHPGIETRSPGLLANTLTIMPMSVYLLFLNGHWSNNWIDLLMVTFGHLNNINSSCNATWNIFLKESVFLLSSHYHSIQFIQMCWFFNVTIFWIVLWPK